MEQYSRREVLKLGAMMTGMLVVPVGWTARESVTFIGYSIDDEKMMGAMRIVGGSKRSITVQADMVALWRSVTLVDKSGNEWTSDDGGETWHYGHRNIRFHVS